MDIKTSVAMALWHMSPHKIDSRSAAVFRLLIALFVIGDIAGRLVLGRIDLAWYTSVKSIDADEAWFPSIQDPNDSPHGAPLHKIWFYRGSEQLQVILFLVTFTLAILFGIGWKFNITSKLLWGFVTALQSRSPILNDGSDRYLRCILFWCMFIPLDSIWSIESTIKSQRNKGEVKEKVDDPYESCDVEDSHGHGIDNSSTPGLKRRIQEKVIVSKLEHQIPVEMVNESQGTFENSKTDTTIISAASLGLTLQIVFMYIGTVLNRSSGTAWHYPKLDAVHYALSSTFASREWAATFIHDNPSLIRIMTASAMVIETMGPLLCFCAPFHGKSWRHLPALLVSSLHLGLWASMRLPQWQLLGIICNVIWTPPCVWDAMERTQKNSTGSKSGTQAANNMKSAQLSQQRSFGTLVRKGFSWFFLLYMIYNFLGEQGWIGKHDNGDIGEAIQFSQYWKMYGPDPPKLTHATVITGRLGLESNRRINILRALKLGKKSNRRINILRALKTGDWDYASEMDEGAYLLMREENPMNMSSRFASWRWENALSKVVKGGNEGIYTARKRAERMARFLCVIGNDKRQKSDITEVEIAFRGLNIEPMGAADRFSHNPRRDREFLVECASSTSYL